MPDHPPRAPLPPHPPSPRRQTLAPPPRRSAVPDGRVSASERDGDGAGFRASRYLALHWRGELPLAAAVIVSAGLLWLAVSALGLWVDRTDITETPVHASLLWLTEVALMIVGVIWWGCGVQRSAVRHADRGGSVSMVFIGGLAGLAAFVWVGAFWYFSARHVAPDVWATISGSARPAAVRVDPQAREVVLEGDLEFGSKLALRALLDAQPQLKMVRLQSRGGRVIEGLRIGEMLRDRGLDTRVAGECSSACVTAFAGGTRRLITPNARLGLHSAGGAGASAQGVARANRMSDAFIAGRGVDWRVLEKGSAVAFDDIWLPPPATLLASGLATDYGER